MELKHVLLTGFEPFGTPLPSDNRSWEAVRQLAGERIVVGSTTVLCHCFELPVSYDPVSELVPRLHLGECFSMVIHCGAGTAGSVRLEQLAHRTDYVKPGSKGKSDLPAGNCVSNYPTPDELCTTVDVERLRSALKSKGWSSVEASSDAGRYLCEFTYYTSLAEALTTYAGRRIAPPKTLFVHVPPLARDPYEDVELAEIVRDIIRIMAE
ncbi:pyroglutamyl-peptidase activity protein [Coemansia thaxteri]|uniref:Pyroglutamyl-peptidase activity protein n=1 Tax=Coemansia thaxteri TaxID=2663907 RepID=A0A9W8BHF5_9FUNG|nr:pyroglutamyl-peptidase activity protein [Coemansia thaxteri]KAJ2007892.1 pyroglutamyl-peptidase activity protein [Coemansia thaxteri]KAJ2472871.1 pyroglutamyl-peptidase activity protein [Coemansia sp. RSA 2322]KAJ2476784.1 pyroglutamyl-peptidase activity protein [Coemansia sp. RSA 2320]